MAESNTKSSWLPDFGDILFLLVLYLEIGLLPNFIFGDCSTGWHLVTGEYILTNWRVPTTDLISSTFPNNAWVAYEWLFDAFIALLERLGGLRLVAVVCYSAIAYMFLMLYRDCRRWGCNYLFCIGLIIPAIFVSAIHWLARPHLVTWFGVYIFTKMLHKFKLGELSQTKLFLWLSLTMLVWVNCHPAFLIGPVVLFIYWFCECLGWIGLQKGSDRDIAGARVKSLTISGVIVMLATLINPYGIKLYEYIFQYMKQSKVIAATQEYASPVFHGQLQPTSLELLYFAVAAGLFFTTAKPFLARFLVVMAFAHLSLSGVRNMPLFVIVAMPFIGELWGQANFGPLSAVANARPAKLISSIYERIQVHCQGFNEMEAICNRHLIPMVTVAVLALSCLQNGMLFGKELVRSRFDPQKVPTKTLESIASNKLDPNRGFNYDNWGGFIRYKTGNRVFIDDRVDFYGEPFYLDYGDIVYAHENWKELLDKHKVEWVLFPGHELICTKLKNDPDWKLLSEDEGSKLYVRRKKIETTNPGSPSSEKKDPATGTNSGETKKDKAETQPQTQPTPPQQAR